MKVLPSRAFRIAGTKSVPLIAKNVADGPQTAQPPQNRDPRAQSGKLLLLASPPPETVGRLESACTAWKCRARGHRERPGAHSIFTVFSRADDLKFAFENVRDSS